MEAQLILNKVELLPERFQQQIVDYIDFLTERYLNFKRVEVQQETDFILTDEIKEILDYRIAHHEANENKAEPAMDALNNIAKKFKYEL